MIKNRGENMGIFNKKIEMKNYVEDDVNNKLKCLNCDALVDKSDKYCWNCGSTICLGNEEKREYQYADLELMKDENLKLAIKNIPDSGIINMPLGIDDNGDWLYCDITKMPNLLIGVLL